MIFTYPVDDERLLLPEMLIHGTTAVGEKLIKQYGIMTRGFNRFGRPKPPSSLDFGEGFYCSYPYGECRNQVNELARTRAYAYSSSARIIQIRVSPDINYDTSLKCVYFDGRLEVDGLEWAKFIAHHRVKKDKMLCIEEPCDGHPDIMIGPVADGNDITAYAKDVHDDKSLYQFYQHISQARWFPEYRQIVFGERALKYLTPQF